MESSTTEGQTQGSSSRVKYVSLSSCFLVETFKGFCKCLGLEFESNKTQESTSTSEKKEGGDDDDHGKISAGSGMDSEDPPSTSTTTAAAAAAADPTAEADPPAANIDDPASIVTANLSRPRLPSVSTGSGPKIN